MSIQFSDTTNKKGLVQFYEKEIGQEYGYISDNTDRLKSFTADVNVASDYFLDLVLKNSSTWKADDSNHTDFPEITTALVSGRRDYTFLIDEQGNQILDIYKVYARTSATGSYKELTPVDPDTQSELTSIFDGQNQTGTPTRYDKTANGILLDLIPSYASSDGLKVSISRENLYFTHNDTTKKPGFYGLYHPYFYLKPALDFARRNGLKNYGQIQLEVLRLEGMIKDGTSKRPKDERVRFTIYNHNNK